MINMTDTKSARAKTCVALGFFDGLHRGHRAVIKTAVAYKEQGLSPAVFTFCSLSGTVKNGGQPQNILSEELKQEQLAALGIEYFYSPPFEALRGMTAEDFVRQVLAERMNAAQCVCGYDFHFGRGAVADAAALTALCRPYGIGVTVVPPFRHNGVVVSSTAIRTHIKNGEIAAANELLGYAFMLKYEVIHGSQRGRTINVPTINQQLPETQVLPKFGVYASKTEVDGELYRSITNIGMKPTVGGVTSPLAETHILGYEGDLYGRTISVRLFAYVRDEEKYESFEALAARIRQDIATVEKTLVL